MKRTIATMGVVGLGLLGATVSANAAPSDKITICHATHSASHPYVAVTMSLSALSGHVTDTADIVPANAGDFMPNGQNLTPENIAILNAGCVVASAPVTSPPVVSPPVTSPPVTSPPVTNPPVTNPPVTSPPVTSPPVSPGGPVERLEPVAPPVVAPVVPPVAAPAAPAPAAATPTAATPAAAGAAAGAAAAPDPSITNVGYNVQTAVGGKADAGIPGWLASLTALFSAVAAFVVVRSGVRARKAVR
ncbi:hypothetical protein [Arthrobacter sp. efr-133-TYG-118]|uniref:hypothetical protein n=1 Tax=Arthrobacter sp. efr-133-TYG-118 TaxID=3040279 RepID=UPI00254EA37F|nr:hypothetical protein [Arthrobacter sp. efr-133-TYG-118]